MYPGPIGKSRNSLVCHPLGVSTPACAHQALRPAAPPRSTVSRAPVHTAARPGCAHLLFTLGRTMMCETAGLLPHPADRTTLRGQGHRCPRFPVRAGSHEVSAQKPADPSATDMTLMSPETRATCPAASGSRGCLPPCTAFRLGRPGSVSRRLPRTPRPRAATCQPF